MLMIIGLVVNPVAGMGGPLGLKGTDGEETLDKVLSAGVQPLSPLKARRAMESLPEGDFRILTGPGSLGEDSLEGLEIPYDVVSMDVLGGPDDTRNLCRVLMASNVEVILFCGGDGTARDVMDSVGTTIPVLGIPSGVKMFSAVFANTPEDIGPILAEFRSGMGSLTRREVLDIDEDDYREGILSARLYGKLSVPYVQEMVQDSKGSTHGVDEEEEAAEVAEYVISIMDPRTLYILGPGTGVQAVMEGLGLKGTILGFDAVRDGKVIRTDLDADSLDALTASADEIKVMLGIIGGQGFILGRGTAQLTPSILRRLGKDSLIILGPPYKTKGLSALRVDTGDPDLDREFRGHIRVIQRFGWTKMMPVI